MIDWHNLAANSLWIVALAIGLATLSYASWAASLRDAKLKIVLNERPYQGFFNLAGLLFSLGLAATSTRWWEMLLWLILALLFLWQTIVVILQIEE